MVTQGSGCHGRRIGRLALLLALALCVAPSAARAQISFSAPTNFPSGDASAHAAVGDFNGDGDPDLAVVNVSPDRVSILVGGAGGSFSAPTSYAATSSPVEVAVADFNGDSDPDLAVAGGNGVAILLGGPGATFGQQTVFPTGGLGRTIAVGDFNGDSDPDLAVGYGAGSAGSVSILTGGQGGTFSQPTNFTTGGGTPNAIGVGDFNGDGDPDLAITNQASNNVGVLLGADAARFTGPATFAVSLSPQSIAVGDLNGDGDPDLAVANTQSGNVSILVGAAGGSFAAQTTTAGGQTPQAVALSDLNGDGDPELIIARESTDVVSVLIAGSGASFSSERSFATGDAPNHVVLADFDGDGDRDIAVTNGSSDDVSVLLNQGTPDPPIGMPQPPVVTPPPPPPPPGAPAGDRDADGVVDATDNCADNANPGQADADRDGIGDACDPSDASAPPKVGETVIARVVSGEVFIRLPAGRSLRGVRAAQTPTGFIPLKGAVVIPVGSTVDAVRGRLSLTSARTADRSGSTLRTQKADFYQGIFQVRQRRGRAPTTDIALRSSNFARVCGRGARAASIPRGGVAVAAQRRSRKVVSRLWGNGSGRFRTLGRHSSATVRGTIWLTEERCDGTLTRVTRGVVSVRDLRARRTVTVRAGRSYLARAVRATVRTRRP